MLPSKYEGRRYSTFQIDGRVHLTARTRVFGLQSLRYDDGRKANIMVGQCLPYLSSRLAHGYPTGPSQQGTDGI